MNSRIFALMLLIVFLAGVGSASAAISSSLTTLHILPVKNFTTTPPDNTGYVSLHVVSLGPTPVPFTASVTLVSGLTDKSSFYVSDFTGSCSGFDCIYDINWGFTVIGNGTITYSANITDNSTDKSIIINDTAQTDTDNDDYPSDIDCDDNNAAVHPGAAEVCGNGLDDDCSGGDAGCPAPSPGPSGGNGHSSGGSVSGGSSGRLLSDTYTCLGNKNIIVTPNDKMLINYKGTNYTLFVKDILTNSVLVKVYPIPSRNLQVTKGDSKSFDLDWNNQNDFRLNVYSTKPNLNANISCDIVSEKAAPAPEKPKEEPKTIPEIISNIKEGVLSIVSTIVPKEKASPIVGGVLALAIIVIGLLSYSLYSRRKSRKDEF